MTARLSDLTPGARFRCCGLTGELIGLSGGSALVKLDSESRRRFVANGENGKREVEFVAGGARQTWSLSTEVEVLP